MNRKTTATNTATSLSSSQSLHHNSSSIAKKGQKIVNCKIENIDNDEFFDPCAFCHHHDWFESSKSSKPIQDIEQKLSDHDTSINDIISSALDAQLQVDKLICRLHNDNIKHDSFPYKDFLSSSSYMFVEDCKKIKSKNNEQYTCFIFPTTTVDDKHNLMEQRQKEFKKVHMIVNGTDSSSSSIGPLKFETPNFDYDDYDDDDDTEHHLHQFFVGGKQEYKRVLKRMIILFINLDLTFTKDRAHSYARKTIQYLITAFYRYDECTKEENNNNTSTESCLKYVLGDQKGLKAIINANSKRNTIHCHVDVRQWSRDYHGLGVILEILSEVKLKKTSDDENDDDDDVVICKYVEGSGINQIIANIGKTHHDTDGFVVIDLSQSKCLKKDKKSEEGQHHQRHGIIEYLNELHRNNIYSKNIDTSIECIELGSSTTKLTFPRYILPSIDHIKSISCSDHHTILLSSLFGFVYSRGDNSDGQLGHGDSITTSRSINTFQQIDSLKHLNIVQISAGGDELGCHSAAIDSNGRLYTWGKGVLCGHSSIEDDDDMNYSFNSLRRNIRDPIVLPKLVHMFSKKQVLKVDSGGSFTVALVLHETSDEDNNDVVNPFSVYTWGLWANGRLGQGKPNQEETYHTKKKKTPVYQIQPKRIETFDLNEKVVIVDIASGRKHALAVSSTGKVYCWGYNGNGQCGIIPSNNKKSNSISSTSVFDDIWSPRNIPPFSSTTHAAKTVHTGNSMSAVVDTVGNLWTWGAGDNNNNSKNSYDLISLLGHGDIHMGESSTFRTKGYYLKSPVWSQPRIIKSMQEYHVAKVSLGSERCAAVTKCGKAFFWGGSKSGDKDDKVPCHPHYNSVLVGKHIVDVECGHDLSFVLTSGTTVSRAMLPKTEENKNNDLLFPSHYDCIIICSEQEKPIYCHKVILSSRSIVFKELLEQHSITNPSNNNNHTTALELSIPTVQYDIMKCLINFLYTDGLQIEKNTPYKYYYSSNNDSKKNNSLSHVAFFMDMKKTALDFRLERLVEICDSILNEFGFHNNSNNEKEAFGEEEKEEKDLANALSLTLLNQDNDADVCFIVDDVESMKAHKCILSARSTFFRKLLASNKQYYTKVQSPEKIVDLMQLLYFIYTGKLMLSLPSIDNDDDGNIEDLTQQILLKNLVMSHKYEVWDMKSLCESSIKITQDNILNLCEIAKTTNAVRLKAKIINYLYKQFCCPSFSDEKKINRVIRRQQQQDIILILNKKYPNILNQIFELIKQRDGGFLLISEQLQPPSYQEIIKRKNLQRKKRQDKMSQEIMNTSFLPFSSGGGENVVKRLIYSILSISCFIFLYEWIIRNVLNRTSTGGSSILLMNVCFLGFFFRCAFNGLK